MISEGQLFSRLERETKMEISEHIGAIMASLASVGYPLTEVLLRKLNVSGLVSQILILKADEDNRGWDSAYMSARESIQNWRQTEGGKPVNRTNPWTENAHPNMQVIALHIYKAVRKKTSQSMV